jgi:proteasome assembly chaperone (PAC2) family protein
MTTKQPNRAGKRKPLASASPFTIVEKAPGKFTHLIMAFKGWPDANEGATEALRFFLHSFSARKLADLDPEEFYDFSQTRPVVKVWKDGKRQLSWPKNEIFYQTSESTEKRFLFLLGTEPSLKWRTYCDAVLNLAQQYDVQTVLHMGALLDAVPHTRALRITGSSNETERRQSLEALKIRGSNYQGPVGIPSAMMERCSARGLQFITLWGHSSHYMQTSPNYKLTLGIVNAVRQVLEIEMNSKPLEEASETFFAEMQKAVEKDSQLSTYIQKLETKFDEAVDTEMPSGDEMVRDVEAFLRDLRDNRR